MKRVVIAITGASGSVYGLRLIQKLLENGVEVHLSISTAATQVIERELGQVINLDNLEVEQLFDSIDSEQGVNQFPGILKYHNQKDFSAGIASGSFLTDGMVICPCSMGTLGALANGMSTNLIHRAADVHLKERRKLIVVPRETPLGAIQLENMKKLAEAGAVVMPASPGFYHQPNSIMDLVDFVVARVCDQLQVEANFMQRWGD